MSGEKRDSKALEPVQITDPVKIAEAEAKNGLRQFDTGIEVIKQALERPPPYRLRLSTVMTLHYEALKGLSLFAGKTRPGDVEIEGSRHQPPPAHVVLELLEDMCDYVNANWSATPIHLAAFVMWRLNWIHPFADGNGRTSRIVSYVVFSIRAGFVLPGSPTIPDYIADDRKPYYAALDAADEADRNGRLDVSEMEQLLGSLLAKQLASFYQSAGGVVPGSLPNVSP